MKITLDKLSQAICESQAITTLDAACEIAGGSGYDRCKGMTVEDFIKCYAPNGIRLTYDDTGHINNLPPVSLCSVVEALKQIELTNEKH